MLRPRTLASRARTTVISGQFRDSLVEAHICVEDMSLTRHPMEMVRGKGGLGQGKLVSEGVDTASDNVSTTKPKSFVGYVVDTPNRA